MQLLWTVRAGEDKSLPGVCAASKRGEGANNKRSNLMYKAEHATTYDEDSAAAFGFEVPV